MKIGFAPCGFTTKEIIGKLLALGGSNIIGYHLNNDPISLYWYIDSISGKIKCDSKNVLDVRLNPNDHKLIIKSLSDLPNEIKGLIKLRQLDAGNKADLSVFICGDEGIANGGFHWDSTEEGSSFWNSLLVDKQYYKYYTLKKTYETKLQREETSIGGSKNITGSGIRCKRRKLTIASGHLRDRKTIKF